MPTQVSEQFNTNWDTVNYQSAQQATEKQSAQEVLGQQNFKGITDGTSSLGGLWTDAPYVANINTPTLAGVAYGLSDQPNGIHEEARYSTENAYFDSFAENLENSIQKYDLNEEQVHKLVMLFMTGALSDDTFLNEVLGELNTATAGDLAAAYDLPSTTDQGRYLKEKGSSYIRTVKENISELQAYADRLPEGSEKQSIQKQINELKQNISGFEQKMGTLNGSPSREELANFANELSQSTEKLAQISDNFSQIRGSDPELGNILAHVQSSLKSTVESLNENLQELVVSWQLSTGDYSSVAASFKETYINNLTSEFDGAFESALNKFTDDPQLQAKLRYAHYHPESATGDLKAVFQQVKQNAINQLNAEGWDIPKGYTPPSNRLSFQISMQNSADDMFEAALEAFKGADGKPLGLEQQNAIRHMYYGITPAEGDLGAISAKLEAQVASGLLASFGLPKGSPVPKGSFYHAAAINGQFQMKFLEQLDTLSPDQKAAVLQAINHPLEEASPETKTLLNQLYNQSLSANRRQFSLSDEWTPPIDSLKGINNLTATQKSAAKAVSEWGNAVNSAIALMASLPQDPNQVLLINVLKVVSQAISRLQEQIAIMMQIESEIAQKSGKSELEASLSKVKIQQEALAKIAKRANKMAKLGPLMGILKVVQVAMTVVMGLTAGPLGLLIAAVLFVDAVSGKKEGTLTKMFNGIASGINKALSPLIGEKAAQAVGMVTNALICVGVVASGAFMIGMQTFFENSQVIQTFFRDILEVGAMAGEIIAMVLQMTFELTVAIVLTIATAGAAGAAFMAQIVQKATQFASKAAEFALKALKMVLEQLEKLAKTLNKFENVSKFIAKMMKEIESFAKTLKFWAQETKWADDLMESANNVEKAAKQFEKAQAAEKGVEKLSLADRLSLIAKTNNPFGKTGYAPFDTAMEQFRQKLSVIQGIITAFEVGTLGIQTYTSVVQVHNSILKAQMAKLQGDMESIISELETMVKTLKKIVSQMLEGLSQASEWLGQIGQYQNSMWTDLSATLDVVAAANQPG